MEVQSKFSVIFKFYYNKTLDYFKVFRFFCFSSCFLNWPIKHKFSNFSRFVGLCVLKYKMTTPARSLKIVELYRPKRNRSNVYHPG